MWTGTSLTPPSSRITGRTVSGGERKRSLVTNRWNQRPTYRPVEKSSPNRCVAARRLRLVRLWNSVTAASNLLVKYRPRLPQFKEIRNLGRLLVHPERPTPFRKQRPNQPSTAEDNTLPELPKCRSRPSCPVTRPEFRPRPTKETLKKYRPIIRRNASTKRRCVKCPTSPRRSIWWPIPETDLLSSIIKVSHTINKINN